MSKVMTAAAEDYARRELARYRAKQYASTNTVSTVNTKDIDTLLKLAKLITTNNK